MDSLATRADLDALGITYSTEALADALLASVSASVRDAAGCPISQQTSTVTIQTEASRRLELPARPVVSVASVSIDGEEITDWVLRGSSLWREVTWQQQGAVPSEVEVTFTHGYATVPADIVTMVCMLTAAGLKASEDGFAGHRGASSFGVDDYRESYATGEDEIVDPTELPERTAKKLRKRFTGRSVVSGGVR